MKKSLLVMLLAMVSFFMFAGISQAGQCIYLASGADYVYYYNSSDVQYSGDIVSYVEYDNNACKVDALAFPIAIDCVRRIFQDESTDGWESIYPGSPIDVARQKLCR